MNKELVLKTLRLFIGVVVFLSLTQMIGVDQREAQEAFLQLAVLVLFGLMVGNIWLTLFIWLSVVIYTVYGFKIGGNYIVNIGFGSLLYYLTKISFKREHIEHYLNMFLWLIFASIVMMTLQLCKWDFVYATQMLGPGRTGTEFVETIDPAAFYGFKACMGVVMAFGVPILLSRWNLTSKLAAVGLFIPLYLSMSSTAVFGAIAGALFVLWYKVNWKIWVATLLVIMSLGTAYLIKVDVPMGMMSNRPEQWKVSLRDAKIHPIKGWGLDSFRKTPEWKPFIYAMGYQVVDGQGYAQFWDNPHNLYVSLAFEWGMISLLLLGGYLRQCFLWFRDAHKSPDTVALMGFLIVFLIANVGQFPMFLARTACFIIPMLGLLEVELRD